MCNMSIIPLNSFAILYAIQSIIVEKLKVQKCLYGEFRPQNEIVKTPVIDVKYVYLLGIQIYQHKKHEIGTLNLRHVIIKRP